MSEKEKENLESAIKRIDYKKLYLSIFIRRIIVIKYGNHSQSASESSAYSNALIRMCTYICICVCIDCPHCFLHPHTVRSINPMLLLSHAAAYILDFALRIGAANKSLFHTERFKEIPPF